MFAICFYLGFWGVEGFFLIVQIHVFAICFYLGFWGVEGALCKLLEILGQDPQRNYLSKSATFDPIFNCYIVHC